MKTQFTYDTLKRGQPLHTVVHVVDEKLIERFCIASGDDHAWHWKGAAPFGARIAPAGVVSIFSTMVLGNPGYDRPPGDIHAAHDYEFLEPIPVGTEVTTSGHVTDKFVRNGRKWVEFATISRGPDGRVFAQCRCTIVVPD